MALSRSVCLWLVSTCSSTAEICLREVDVHESINSASILQIQQATYRTTPKDVCFFVKIDTARQDTDGRSRAAAVASSWGSQPAQGSRIFYFVGESVPPYHLPEAVQEDQIIRVVRTDYVHLPERSRHQFIQLNSKAIKDSCAWFAVVDDDAYVNTAQIVSKLSVMDASGVHYMGAVFKALHAGEWKPFVHGSLQMFSVAAVPLIARVAAECDDWGKGMEDVNLAVCIDRLGLSSRLPAKDFFRYFLNNSRGQNSSTLRDVLRFSESLNSSLGCFDFVHKLLPEDMLTFHSLVRDCSPCTDEKTSSFVR
eukprot:TRINITY_DN22981_c0_g1_i1.p1 TRINITY_DN22981_c0_g1~~TRINITY_DN22981_c0_g1_i1.p1  ORF type:complete len:309 (-),score=41.62 TRINITY_DN22981_c0_g1_i1:28-954(-)